MPAFRNVRRSRRLSRQPPRDPGSDEFDLYDFQLMYPGDAPSSSFTAATPAVQLPPPDETGEPEVDLESPHLPSPVRAAAISSQRSSHSRKKKPGHIPRPPNAFMIFRSELWNKEKIKSTVERDHRQISRIAGNLWNSLTDDERAPYQERAEEAKRLHAQTYPQYKYSPIYRRDKPTKRKPKQDHSDKVLRCHAVALLIQQGFEGDDLKRELDRLEGHASEDDRESDSSDYVAPRRKRTSRVPAKSSAPRRRQRAAKVKDEEEYSPSSHEDVPMRDELVKQEMTTPVFAQPSVCPADDPDAFIPTSEIPPLELGDACLNEEIRFTNPFASASSSPQSFVGGALTPEHQALSDDFLAPASESSKFQCSSPADEFSGLFAPDSDGPLYDPAQPVFHSPSLATSHPYYATEYMPGNVSLELDFSEWMRYDE
ncbi:hypothetical protein GY45DRAFT_210794 [Cubamyces sp. BRFM 1775]|nr:hypothetical protein GY45DRAFT_210794 [Cubamyces sp. BRFM 1775]